MVTVFCELVEGCDCAPGWVAQLLSALAPAVAHPERTRLAAQIFARGEHTLMCCARARVEALLEGAGETGREGSDGESDSDAEPGQPEGKGRRRRAGPAQSAAQLSRLPLLVSRLAAACPALLPSLGEGLGEALHSVSAGTRAAATRLLLGLFAGEHARGAGEQRQLFALLLARFEDKLPQLRVDCCRWALDFLVAEGGGGAGADAACCEVRAVLQARLLDWEDCVRAAAVKTAFAVAVQRPAQLTRELLGAACAALKDCKDGVHREALQGLAAAYSAYLQRCATAGSAAEAPMFDELPSLAIAACMREGGSGPCTLQAAVDSLMDGRLFPLALPPNLLAAAWVRAHCAAGGEGAATMEKVLTKRGRARAAAQQWLEARQAARKAAAGVAGEAEDGDGESDGESEGEGVPTHPPPSTPSAALKADQALRQLATYSPRPAWALGELQRLSLCKDGYIFRALQALLSPDTRCHGPPAPGAATDSQLRADCARRVRACLGAKAAACLPLLEQLCCKLSPLPFDAPLLHQLFEQLRLALPEEGDGDGEGSEGGPSPSQALPPRAAAALGLLTAAAAAAPALFRDAGPPLLMLLRERACAPLLSASLRLLCACAPGLGGGAAALERSFRAPLAELCTAGDRRQAKLAAEALLRCAPAATQPLLAALLARLPQLSDCALAPALAAAAVLCGAVEERAGVKAADELQAWVGASLWARPHARAAHRVAPSAAAVLNAHALRACTVARLRAHQGSASLAAVAAAEQLARATLMPLLRGTGRAFEAAAGAEAAGRAHLRCAAAACLLKLARKRGYEATLQPDAYALLAAAAQATCPLLRCAVRRPLMRAVEQHRPPSVRVCALLPLCCGAGAQDRVCPGGPTVAAAMPACLRSCVCMLRHQAAQLAAQAERRPGGEPQQGAALQLALCTERMLFFTLWALAHTPGVPCSAEEGRSQPLTAFLPLLQLPLHQLLNALLASPPPQVQALLGAAAQQQAHKPGACLPQLVRMLRQLKLSSLMGGQGPQRNHALYSACDVAAELLRVTAQQEGWDSSLDFPMQVPLPKAYFSRPPALQPLSPNELPGAPARSRPSASFLPPGFALLEEEPEGGQGAGGRAGGEKKRKARAGKGGASEEEGEEEAAPAGRKAKGGGGGRKAAPAKKRKPQATSKRAQPRRAAAKRAPLLSESDASEGSEGSEEQVAPAKPQPQQPQQRPLSPIPSSEEQQRRSPAPPRGKPRAVAAPVAAPARFMGVDSDESEDEEDRKLNPVRKPQAAPQPQPQPQPESESEPEEVRRTGRSVRRRH